MSLIIALIALAFWLSYGLSYIVFGGMLMTWLLESWTESPMPTWAVYVDIFAVIAGSLGLHYLLQKIVPGGSNFFNYFKGTTSKSVSTSHNTFQEDIAEYGKRSIIAYLTIASTFILVFGWAFGTYGR